MLEQLVAISSVSSQSNRPMIEWIQSRFAAPCWHTAVFAYKDARGVEKLNLIVSSTPAEEGTFAAELALVCHTDTVPYDATWTDATTLVERAGNLHGCGACDVKGFLACIVAACEGMEGTLVRPLCLVFTADEEIGCRGARFLLQHNALRARYAIVGEPTNLHPARAGKGYALAAVQVLGRAAHSAFPAAGVSAIFAAGRLLCAFEDLAVELQGDRDDSFSPPYTTLNVGEIHGGTAKNIVAAECSFQVEWRPIPSQRAELVYERLQELASGASVEGLEIRVELLRLETGFATPRNSPLLRLLERPDTPMQTLSFGTEAPWLARMGAEVVVLGPGSMLTAHSPRECVPAAELEACVDLLRTAVNHFCR